MTQTYLDPRKKKIIMLGIDPAAMRGGIWAVVRIYAQAGLFKRWPIIYLGTTTVGTKTRKLLLVLRALVAYSFLLVVGQVRLVHIHASSYASFWRKSVFVVLALLARRPIILHIHSGRFGLFFWERGVLGRRFIRFILDNVTQIVVVSDGWHRQISEITKNPRIAAIPNPVDPELLETPITADRRGNALLFLGDVQRDKGVFELLDALAEVRLRVPDVRVRIGGEGDLPGVQHRAMTRGIARNVELLGWVSGEEKRRVLMESSIFVLPSYWEGMPVAVLEAMAAGLPVVTTRVGGLPEVVDHEVNGFLVEPGNCKQLRDALLTLLQDPKLCSRMSEASRQKMRDLYSSDRVLRKIEKLYTECSESPRQSGEKERATCETSRSP